MEAVRVGADHFLSPPSVGQPPYSTFDFKGEPGAYRFHFLLSTEILGTYYPVPYELSVSDSFTLLPAP